MSECQWFLGCHNTAAGWSPHPILGGVEVCQRCADVHDLPVYSFAVAVEEVMAQTPAGRWKKI